MTRSKSIPWIKFLSPAHVNNKKWHTTQIVDQKKPRIQRLTWLTLFTDVVVSFERDVGNTTCFSVFFPQIYSHFIQFSKEIKEFCPHYKNYRNKARHRKCFVVQECLSEIILLITLHVIHYTTILLLKVECWKCTFSLVRHYSDNVDSWIPWLNDSLVLSNDAWKGIKNKRLF